MAKTRIEWAEATWNPLSGCSKTSPGCKNCYANRMAERLQRMGVDKYRNGFQLTLHPASLEIPKKWSRPRLVFVNSMSDLFHSDVPLTFIESVFSVMSMAKQHQFQVLTKRAERLSELLKVLEWPANVWMGVSVETQDYIYRVEHLRKTKAAIKFVSIEPLLGPLSKIPLDGIDWVIVGGESGPGARPMHRAWVMDVRDQCLRANIPFFFKQWGGTRKKAAGRSLEGRTWDEMPLRVPARND